MNRYKDQAAIVAAALRTFAERPENIDNFESYLSQHFEIWLEKYANTPENIAAELVNFSTMEV